MSHSDYIANSLAKIKGIAGNSKLHKECRKQAFRLHTKKDIIKVVNVPVFWDLKLKKSVRKFFRLGGTIKLLKKRNYNRLSKAVIKPQQKHYLSYHKANPEQAYIQRYSVTYNKWLADQVAHCGLNTMQ